MSYMLETKEYSGPLDTLLSLIEERKLDVNQISLSKVTEDFLRYVRTLEKIETPFLADFVLIASRLIFLKSKTLLPDLRLSEEEESDIHDLERRLALYKELKPAMKLVDKLWREGTAAWSRPYFLHLGGGENISEMKEQFFYPGKGITHNMLAGSLSRIFESFRKMEAETQVLKEKIVTIEEKIQEVLSRLTTEGKISFGKLSGASASEIVIVFLAILHLARDQRITLEQDGHFSDIIITTLGS